MRILIAFGSLHAHTVAHHWAVWFRNRRCTQSSKNACFEGTMLGFGQVVTVIPKQINPPDISLSWSSRDLISAVRANRVMVSFGPLTPVLLLHSDYSSGTDIGVEFHGS